MHHARKGGAKMRAGQALRGSSEFHAWGDSNLYLRRHGEQLTLSVEHRAAASINTISLHLETAADAVALTAIGDVPTTIAPPPVAPSVEQRIREHLDAAATPVTAAALRKLCQVRNATLQAALAALIAGGHVRKDHRGYAIAR